MAISDAFLKGQQITQQAQNQKLGLLQALINRPMRGGGAVSVGGGGRGRAIEPLDQGAEDEIEAERLRRAERHEQEMERGRLENAIVRQSAVEQEEIGSMKAWDRAIQAAEQLGPAGDIRRGAQRDILDAQEQQRHYRAYSDAIYRGDAAAADRHFGGMFPGMGGEGGMGTAAVRRQAKDPDTGKLMTGPDGEPIMEEAPTQYGAEGQALAPGQEARPAGYPKHRSDGGVVYMQFGEETPVPVGPGRLRQFHMAISQAAQVPVGAGTARAKKGQAGTTTAAVPTEKEKSQIALNRAKAAGSVVAGGVAYAEATPVETPEGEDPDPYAVKTAQQFQKDLVTGMGMIAGMSGTKQKEAGMPTAIRPMGPQASREFARRSRAFYDNQRKSGGQIPNIPQMIEVAKAEHGLGVAHELTKIFKAELTPSDLAFSYKDPNEKPDFGHGAENVIHIGDPDTGLFIAVDKDLGQLRFANKQSKSWEPMTTTMENAYINLLNDQANRGDKRAEQILTILDIPRAEPFSLAQLMDPLGKAAVGAAKRTGEFIGEEAERMGRWVPGGRPRQLGGQASISPTPGQ